MRIHIIIDGAAVIAVLIAYYFRDFVGIGVAVPIAFTRIGE